MTQQAGLDVLLREWLLQERIVIEVVLPNLRDSSPRANRRPVCGANPEREFFIFMVQPFFQVWFSRRTVSGSA